MIKTKRTRNGGTWTESQYWTAIRSALRHKFSYWKPGQDAKLKARRKYSGKGRRKWEYQCNVCKQWFADKDVQIDHIKPVGSLKSYDDIVQFIKNLTPESTDNFQCLCCVCHQKKTNLERKLNKQLKEK